MLHAERLTLEGEHATYPALLGDVPDGCFVRLSSDPAAYESGGYTLNGAAVSSRDPARAQRWRLSPNLTWYPTEFSKIRLQYNFDDRALYGVDHSVWLQFEFVLGAHAAHSF